MQIVSKPLALGGLVLLLVLLSLLSLQWGSGTAGVQYITEERKVCGGFLPNQTFEEVLSHEEVFDHNDPNIDSYKWSIFTDGRPFLFTNPETKAQAIICTPQKVGSTMWKQLLGKVGGYYTNTSDFGRIPPHRLRPPITHGMFLSALQNKSVPRFLFSRNPYSKLLSGYLDKVEKNQTKELWPYKFKFTLAEAKSSLEHRRQRFVDFVSLGSQYGLNPHFAPISSLCNIDKGMQYDFVLKKEQIDLWYEWFVSSLGLEEGARSGWNMHTEMIKSDQECFYATKGRTCDDMFRKNSSLSVDRNIKKNNPTSPHATNSDAKVTSYYKPETIEMVNKIFEGDFCSLEYPLLEML